MMTFELLAELVAKDFQEAMDEDGFETFKEFRKANCWEMIDIKQEVESIISIIAEEYYQNGDKEGFWMADDYSFIQIGICDEMSWGDFKKLVFSHLK